MRILITGVGGFVGGHLVTAWRKQLPDAEICGLGLHKPDPQLPLETFVTVDLRNAQAVQAVLSETVPTWIVRLAAQSFVAESFANPRETWEINCWGTFHLLEALRKSAFSGRLLFVGSGDQYGKVKAGDLPIAESQPLRPNNPYAASKAAAELLCYQYSQSYGLDVVLARPFSHIGPGQSPRFVVSDFCRQVARIEFGLQTPVLSVGNIEVSRDFLHVRDVVAAYRCLLERGKTGEAYNVCSGREVWLRELVEMLVGYSSRHVEIRVDPDRRRPTDTPRVSGRPQKLIAHTRWRPTTDMLTCLREVLDYWKEEVRP